VSSIIPALMAEKWAQLARHLEQPNRTVADWDDSLSRDPSENHRLAALALHGHPFGFTHEDVTTLRELAKDAKFRKIGNGTMKLSIALTGLADRIAALLPPEKE